MTFVINNTDIAGFKDNVSKKLTDSNGSANVTLIGKSKGAVTVKAIVKVNGELIEDTANIKVV